MEIRKCKKCGFILGTRPNISDVDGVCTPCINAEKKKNIDFKKRQAWLTQYIKDNKGNGEYDCLVAVSGGKDSHMIVKRLVENHGIKKPLLVTLMDEFTPTQAGIHNRKNISEQFDCDHIYYRFSPKSFREHAREDFINDCFSLKWYEEKIYAKTFDLAKKFGINLVFYGENAEFEYGANEELEIFHPLSDDETKVIFLGAIYPYSIDDSLKEAREVGFKDLDDFNEWQRSGQIENHTQVDSIGYIVAVWLKFIKFGFQRVSDIACRYVRDGKLTREQAELLIKENDWQLDKAAKRDFCQMAGITDKEFDEVIDRFANRDLLIKDINGNWRRKDYYDPQCIK